MATTITGFTDVDARPSPGVAQLVSPVSVESQWQEILGAAGPESADNAGAHVVSLAQIADRTTPSTLYALRVARRGTQIKFRMEYDEDNQGNVTTECVIQAFGLNADGSQMWELHNVLDSLLAELTVAVTDVEIPSGGSAAYTESDQEHTFDMEGAAFVVVAVKVAYVTTGTGAVESIQAKVV